MTLALCQSTQVRLVSAFRRIVHFGIEKRGTCSPPAHEKRGAIANRIDSKRTC